eukprot:TRINITY_DN24135_c0_g1_i1.p1 TRINITY_DN24135_c0_g1~~TRINITY_DN24135_c0_g1_i1.p1  ORF type:complete len:430 (+),score=112.64 TRINITY_DN24135_c0_g1_i1:177-1466(+)
MSKSTTYGRDRQVVLFKNDGHDDASKAALLIVHGNWTWSDFLAKVAKKLSSNLKPDAIRVYLAPYGVEVKAIDEFTHNSKLWVDLQGRDWAKPRSSTVAVPPAEDARLTGRALRVLIPFDKSVSSLVALRHGLHLAKQLEAEVTLMHALDNEITLAWEGDNQFILDSLREKAHTTLKTGVELATAAGVPCKTLAPIASPSQAVISHGASHDLVVMGTHGKKGFKRGILGSVAEEVLRHSNFPVIFVRANDADTNNELSIDWNSTVYSKVFVAWNNSPYAEEALRGVLPLASVLDCELVLAFVEDPKLDKADLDDKYISGLTPEEQIRHHINESLKIGVRIATDSGPFSLPKDKVSVKAVLCEGKKKKDIAKALLAAADECGADLISMGTHGRTGLSRLVIGSVTEYVMRHTSKPVMAVGDRRYFSGHGI